MIHVASSSIDLTKPWPQSFLTPCVKISQLSLFLFVNPAKPSMFATSLFLVILWLEYSDLIVKLPEEVYVS